MKKTIVLWLWVMCAGIIAYAQKKGKELTPAQQAKEFFEVYESKNPFKKTKKVALIGVDLQFRMATNQVAGMGRNDDASSRVWVTLNPPASAELMQDITNAYYNMLKTKLTQAGFDVVDEKALQQKDEYKDMIVDDNRLYVNKDWGIMARASANEAAIIKYPKFAGGAHAKLANRNDVLIWNSNTLVDFVWIDQSKVTNVKRGTIDVTAAVSPAITIHDGSAGLTSAGMAAQMKLANSSNVWIQGPDYSAYNVSLKSEKSVYSEQQFHNTIEKCTNCIPEFAERTTGGKVLRESLVVLSGGRGGNKDNTDFKFMFEVQADYDKYKAAVLDALDKYSDLLILNIKQ